MYVGRRGRLFREEWVERRAPPGCSRVQLPSILGGFCSRPQRIFAKSFLRRKSRLRFLVDRPLRARPVARVKMRRDVSLLAALRSERVRDLVSKRAGLGKRAVTR